MNADELHAMKRAREHIFEKFRGWLCSVNGRTVDLFEGEFYSVFDRMLQQAMETARFEVGGGRLPNKDWRECVVLVADFLMEHYQRAEGLVQDLMNENGGEVSWTLMRKLLAGSGESVAWVTMLRMSHLSGDYGEDEKRARDKLANSLYEMRAIDPGPNKNGDDFSHIIDRLRGDNE